MKTFTLLLATTGYCQAKKALRGTTDFGVLKRNLQKGDQTAPPSGFINPQQTAPPTDPATTTAPTQALTTTAPTNPATTTAPTTVAPTLIPPLDPIALDDFYATIEGSKLNVKAPGVLENDEPLGYLGTLEQPLFVKEYEELLGFEGSLKVYDDGKVRYEPPDIFFVGFEYFQYTVCYIEFPDICETALVEIDVFEDVNRPDALPVANDILFTDLGEGDTLEVAKPGILFNDEVGDPPNPLFVCDVDDKKTKGDLKVDDDGSFVYTAPTCFTGTDEFTYRACYVDYEYLESNKATISLEIDENRPGKPTAKDDSYETKEGIKLKVSKSKGLLDNDSGDTDLFVYKYTLSSGFEGTLDVDSDGSLDYYPEPGELGTFEFTYEVCLKDWPCVDCDEGTVKIKVEENPEKPDGPPSLGDNDDLAVTPGGVLQGNVFRGAEYDTESTLVASNYRTPTGFVGTLNGQSDGYFTYGNAPVGNQTFTYKACYKEWPDLCSTGSVTVTTAVGAIAAEGTTFLYQGFTVREDGPPLQIVGDADGDLDVPGYPLQECQSDCDSDDECAGDLICYERSGSDMVVPGCSGDGADFPSEDFCIRRESLEPTLPYLLVVKDPDNGGVFSSPYPLQACQGDCDKDTDCAAGLMCFQRSKTEVVPGCLGNGASFPRRDFCIERPPSMPGSIPLTDADRHERPLAECEGDCNDDDDCAGGLICYRRRGWAEVPGCTGSGSYGKDYCIRSPFSVPATLMGREGNPDLP